MKIALASDHAGYELKKEIIIYLQSEGLENKDFGCYSKESVDYADFAEKAVRQVVSGKFDRAILICGTGIGMSLAANKFRGIRATLCCDAYMAEMSRKHNNSNCLTMGGRILPADEAVYIVEIWLNTEFEGERHQKRLDKISKIEEMNFKPVK
ncbi:MAG: ribose 5-phosphate isomerase B [Candidatus Aminicenantes bacterium]|nr:ribose 5-phosphate isomerase B [Candidatus Aminicenantes bacterium]